MFLTDITEMVNEKSLKNLNGVNGIAGPGRPKSGRAQCIETLDKMLKKAGNQEKLEKDLQVKFDNDPGAFLRGYIFPLLPRDVNLTFENDIAVLIRGKAQQLVESVSEDFALEEA